MVDRSFSLFIASRYLLSTRRDAFITFLSVVTAGSITLGVAALLLALAALTGFQEALRGEILERTPQLEIRLPKNSDSREIQALLALIPEVETVARMLQGRGWLVAGSRFRSVEITGFEGRLPNQFPQATGAEPGLYVSRRLADSWMLEPGDVLEIVSIRPSLTPLGPRPRVRRLPLTGTFPAGRTEQEERLALSYSEAAVLLNPSQETLVVKTANLESALRIVPKLQEVLPKGSSIETWQDLNRALLFALRLEKSLMFLAVFLIVVVAAMSLVADLNLILASKRAEVGMLGAMGASPGTLQRVFLWLGAFLVAVGSLAGLGLGVGGAWILDRFEILSLPGQVYFLDHVPFTVRWFDVVMVLGVTLGLSLGSSWIAARRAAALSPVEALRR